MRLYEFVSRSELLNVKKIADQLWSKVGVDIAFSNHFFDRINDHRNFPKINAKELADLFVKEYKMYAKDIANENDITVVLQDIFTNLNVPVAVVPRPKDKKRLLAKTIMRTDNFKTPEKTYKVQ